MKRSPVQWLEATVTSNNGRPLTGTEKYRLRFDAGALPPAYDFWSISIYHSRTRANWIERYSAGDWSEGLVHEDDGSLRLYLQHAPPAWGTGNWIQTPSDSFTAVVRLYEPCVPILNGSYILPRIEASVIESTPDPRWETALPSTHPDPDAGVAVIGFELMPR